jgi:hypothetical protein
MNFIILSSPDLVLKTDSLRIAVEVPGFEGVLAA